MIALTQDMREKLIKDCEFDLKSLANLSADFPENKSFQSALLRQKVALAALTASAVGSFHIYEQKVDATTDYVRDGEWPIDEGELLVYAAPPVPEIKLPEDTPDLINLNIDEQTEFNRGFWFAVEKTKRLNGLGG